MTDRPTDSDPTARPTDKGTAEVVGDNYRTHNV